MGKKEQSLLNKIQKMVGSDAKMYYIFWRYYPDYLTEHFDNYSELTSYYKVFTKGMTEDRAKLWLCESTVQTSIKYLLQRIHQSKMIELYSIYFERAKTDTNAFKAFIEFSEKFFEGGQEDELLSILGGVHIDENSND